jgi:hypothetical protein
MKKLLLFGGLTLVVLALGIYITLQFFLGSIVKGGVNKFGPSITQTKVELQDAKISPFSGVGTLSGLSVGNPAGWSAQDAFRLGKVHIDMEPFSVLDDHIVINAIIVEQPEFVYETRLVSSNVGDLLKNIEKSVGRNESEPKTKSGQPVKMVVKKLVLKDGRVTVGAGGAAMTLPMPAIDMIDIGVAEGGVTPAQVAAAIMRNVTTNVVAAATGALAKGALSGEGGAAETAKQVGAALKGIFGGGKTQSPPASKEQPAK